MDEFNRIDVRHAFELEIVRDKILDRLPAEARDAYPKPRAVGPPQTQGVEELDRQPTDDGYGHQSGDWNS